MTQISFKKRVLFTITVIIGLPLLFLVSAELFIRFYIHLRYGVAGKKYGIYIPDRELGALHRPNSYNLNSVMNNWGFRNTEDIAEEKPRGALRIYCSGGSTTFCYNLSTQEAWPSLLQKKLRQFTSHKHDEVINAGSISFALAHELILAKRFIPRLKPDIVVLYGAGINEQLGAWALENAGVNLDKLLKEKHWAVAAKNLDQARFLKRHSTLVKFYDYYVARWISKHILKTKEVLPETVVIHPWVIENFEHTLRDYIAFFRGNGCRIIFVHYGDSGVQNWYFDNYIRIFRERALAIAQAQGVIIYDFAAVVRRQPQRAGLYIDTAVHLTPEGSELLADGLCGIILKLYGK